MKYTSIFKFKKPDRLDPIKIDDLNDNVDLFEYALTDFKSKKLDMNGNASNLLLEEISEVVDSAEELSTGYSLSKLFGIIKKQIAENKANLLQSVKILDIYDGTDSTNTKIPASAASVKNVQDQIKQIENSVSEIKEEESTYLSRFSNSIILNSSGKTTIQLHDSSDAPVVDLNILGASDQVTTTGAQLFNIDNGITSIQHDEDGWIRVDIDNTTGTTVKYVACNVNPSPLIQPQADYLVVCEARDVHGVINIRVVSDDQNNPSQFLTEFGINAVTDGYYQKTCTTKNNISAAAYMLRTVFNVPAGAKSTAKIRLSVITDTSITQDTFTWEPYTGGKSSPSPEYLQPIWSVGTAGVGAQLLDNVNANYKVNVSSVDSFTKTESGIEFVTTKQFTTSGVYLSYFIKEDDIYSISCDITVSSKDFNQILIGFGDALKTISVDGFTPNDPTHFTAPINATQSSALVFYVNTIDKDVGLNVKFENIMVVKGDTPKLWEPYTGGRPSPSVEYPQVLEVGVAGEQLQSFVDKVITHVGVTLTIKNDVISLLGTATYSGGRNTLKLPDVILPAGQYTMSLSESITAIIVITDETDYILVQGENIKQLNFTTKNDSTIHIGFNVVGGNTYNITDLRIMLNAGDTSLPWEPHRSTTAAVTLTEPLRGIGDVHDQIMCRDGVWGIDRRISSVTYDGVKNTMLYLDFDTPDPDWCYLSNSGRLSDSISNGNKFLCDKFRYLGNPQSVQYNYCAGFNAAERYKTFFYVQIKKLDLVSLDASGVSLYLKSNPVTVYYLCSHPAWEPFPAATQAALNALHTYYGTTYITVIDPLNPEIAVEYVADTKNYIKNEHDKLRSEFNTQIAHILSLLPTETQAAIVKAETNQLLESVESE